MKLYEIIIIIVLLVLLVLLVLFLCKKKKLPIEVPKQILKSRSAINIEQVPSPKPTSQFNQVFPLAECNECWDHCEEVSPIGCDGSASCAYYNRVQCIKDCNSKPSNFVRTCNDKPLDSNIDCETSIKQYCETLATATTDSTEGFAITFTRCLQDAKKNPGKFPLLGCL